MELVDYPEKIRADLQEMATGTCSQATLCSLAAFAMHECNWSVPKEREWATRILRVITDLYDNCIGVPTLAVGKKI